MANVPNYNDLQRLRRLAMNDVASYKMVMQRRGTPQATVFDPQAGLPAYQKNGWNLSLNVTVSSGAFALDTKTLVQFDANASTYATYQNAPFTTLTLGNYLGVPRWTLVSLGTVFFYLSTVDNSIYTKTPVKMQTLTVPVTSYAVWITTDTVNWPVSSLYVQPVY
jgi:hypothetical protein